MEAVVVCELLVYGRADCCCFHDVNRFSVALSHPFMPAKLISAASSKSDGYDFQVNSCRIRKDEGCGCSRSFHYDIE